LIIHLKRFHYSSSTHRREKIDVLVDFPLRLDLSTRVAHWADCEKPIYDCFAVSNHYGGLGGGHYSALARGQDGVWCYYDDGRVTVNVDQKEVVSAAAYVLYYRRSDVPIGETLSLNLQMPLASSDSAPAVIHDQDKDLDLDDVSSTNTAMVDEMSLEAASSIEEEPHDRKKNGDDFGGSSSIFPRQ
jgi:hypothetical protein